MRARREQKAGAATDYRFGVLDERSLPELLGGKEFLGHIAGLHTHTKGNCNRQAQHQQPDDVPPKLPAHAAYLACLYTVGEQYQIAQDEAHICSSHRSGMSHHGATLQIGRVCRLFTRMLVGRHKLACQGPSACRKHDMISMHVLDLVPTQTHERLLTRCMLQRYY